MIISFEKNNKRRNLKALLDGDLILFRSAFSAEKDKENIAIIRARTTIERILDTTEATGYELWFSDKRENNFRFQLEPQYKANRTKPLPVHYKAVRQYLEEEWGAQVSLGQEADDALGISQTQGNGNTILVSIDKDMKQISGKHYNWVREELTEINSQDALVFFYQQLLTGDKTDNILSPCYRMGPEKAQSLLAYCESEEDMLDVVKNQYQDDSKLLHNGKLLWIRKKPNEIWELPKSGG